MEEPDSRGAAFWTPVRHIQTRSMRRYRELWRGLDPVDQWRLECTVYALRGRGLPEREVGQHVEAILEAQRPWRLSDAQLFRRLKYAWKTRARLAVGALPR